MLSGGNLATLGRLEVLGGLVLSQGAELVLTGPGAELRTPGGFSNVNSNLRATEGAVVALTLPAEFNAPGDFTSLFPLGAGFVASNARLKLDGMTTATGPIEWNFRGAPSLLLLAEGGGRLQMPTLGSLSGRTELRVDGFCSVIEAPLLQTVTGPDADFVSVVDVRNGGELQAAAFREIQYGRIVLLDGGVLRTASLVLSSNATLQGKTAP